MNCGEFLKEVLAVDRESEELVSGSLLEELTGELVSYMMGIGFGTVDIRRDSDRVFIKFRALTDRALSAFKPFKVKEFSLEIREGSGFLDFHIDIYVLSTSEESLSLRVDRALAEGHVDKPLEGRELLKGFRVLSDGYLLSFQKEYSSQRLLEHLSEVLEEGKVVPLGELICRDLRKLLMKGVSLLPGGG